MFSKLILTASFGAAVFFIVSGCTDIERGGYSPIPQNTPSSWELRPYGEMRN